VSPLLPSTPPAAPGAGRLVGVGVGPGDPELVTLRAVRVLERADRVVAPATAPDAVGRAEAVVRQVCPNVRVERLPYPMRDAEPHRAVADALVGHLDRGETVAFVTLGDPTLYSTFSSVARAVREARPGVRIDRVPGITAFQELACRTGTVLADGTETVVVVTALDGPDRLAAALADEDASVVVYKGGRHLPALVEAARQRGRLAGAVVGELLGLPGERVVALEEAGSGPGAYLVTALLPPAARAAPGAAPSRELPPGKPRSRKPRCPVA
jgi:precorrin-2/cobalt-factor-2 C20-methyltransferase